MLSEPIRIVAQVAEVLDTLGVQYLVGGSLGNQKVGPLLLCAPSLGRTSSWPLEAKSP